jgi:hypothetical protein
LTSPSPDIVGSSALISGKPHALQKAMEMVTKIAPDSRPRHNQRFAPPPPSSGHVVLDFTEAGVKEQAGAETDQEQRIECLVGLLLELNVSELKLQDHQARMKHKPRTSSSVNRIIPDSLKSTRRSCTLITPDKSMASS